MYIHSRQLTGKIAEISKEAEIKSNHALSYVEFVAVPCFGQIVLRFMLNDEDYTLEDLDHYESMLNSIAGEDFLCDFMGSVYRKVGVDYSNFEQRLIRSNERFTDEPVLPSSHSVGIREDANTLLKAAGLDPDIPVWEIQAEEDEYILLLMGEENKPVMTVTEPIRLTVGKVDRRSCSGLIKGAVYCRRNHISLARILLNE